MLARIFRESEVDRSVDTHPDNVGLVFVFASRAALSSPRLLEGVRRRWPFAAICGCSTGGQIVGDVLTDDESIVIAFEFERTIVRIVKQDLVAVESSRSCGEALGASLAGAGLRAVFVVADGLCVNGNELVAGLSATAGDAVTIAGGMAADGSEFASTLVVAGDTVASNLVAAVGFYGDTFRMRTGIGDGWQVFGPRRTVTHSDGNRVYALDGEPILDLYRRFLDDEDFAGLPRAGLLFPLQIRSAVDPERVAIRAVLGVDHEDGALIFGGDIPTGSIAQMMRGTADRLVDGAAEAARQVVAQMPSDVPSECVAILISCIGRRLLMGSRIEDEVAAAGSMLRATPRAGFYSLGEICPFIGGVGVGLHNETMTIVTLSEED